MSNCWWNKRSPLSSLSNGTLVISNDCRGCDLEPLSLGALRIGHRMLSVMKIVSRVVVYWFLARCQKSTLNPLSLVIRQPGGGSIKG